MIETVLFNYGVLGLWTLTLIIKERTIIKDNTLALTKNTNVLFQLKELIKLKL